MIVRQLPGKIAWRIILLVLLSLLIGCSGRGAEEDTAVSTTDQTNTELLTLPSLSAAELNGEPLQVIASTSIIGDVVAQVGGDAIDLTTLMTAGQDPHSYDPGAQTLTAVAQADVIFINGWDLEESLVHDLETIGEDVPVVAISANIEPLPPGEEELEDVHEEEDEHNHSGADPHVWFDIQNVVQWTENAAQVLAELDPTNAEIYQANATAYMAELADLETYVQEQLAAIPGENRALVTNHDSFGYFAQAYDFEILGTVVPGSSTIAEPSAADLTALIGTMEEHNVCTIFTETTVSDSLSQTVAAELDECAAVQVVPLYTGAIGPVGSGAESYIDMFRANVEAIVTGLK
jgi:zinc/manganese transport system substrate-binding protein/manganese/iron transport system substrate-binding protein